MFPSGIDFEFGHSAFKLISNYIEDKVQSSNSILISGMGATGKSICSRLLSRYLFGNLCNVVEFDDFILPRFIRLKRGLSGMNPGSYDVDAFNEVLNSVLSQVAVRKPYYDHRHGSVCLGCDNPEHGHFIAPQPNTIVVGAPIADRRLRSFEPTFSFFFEYENIEMARRARVKRDCMERGRSLFQAEFEFEKTIQDYYSFYISLRDSANAIIKIDLSSKNVSIFCERGL